MKRWWLGVRLAVLASWMMGTAVATAQDEVSIVVVPQSQALVVPTNEYLQPVACPGQSQGRTGDCGARGEMGDSPLRRGCEALLRPFVNCLNDKGLGCCATHNSFGCTSLYAQCTFIFGSCRQFFMEPCVSPPPGNPCGGATGCGGGR
jgi:hypothetical protein